MSKSWPGENEIQNCLIDLVGDCSISKIKQLCSSCFKYQNEYKMVVFEVEKFIKKSSPEDRLAGLFGLDAICKASRSQFGKEKDIFSNRFALRLKDTLTHIDYNKLSDKEKSTVSRMFDEWRRKEMFGDVIIPVVVNPLPERESSKSKEKSTKTSSIPPVQVPPPIQPPIPPHMQPQRQQQPQQQLQQPPHIQPPIPPPPMPPHLQVPVQSTYYPNAGFNNYPENASYVQQGTHQPNYSFNPPPQYSGVQQPYDNFQNNIGNFNTTYNDSININYNNNDFRNFKNSNMNYDNFNQFDAYNNQFENTLKPQENQLQPEIVQVDTKPEAKSEKRKTSKVCPFRSGDCPFNEKCRYSHYEWNVSLSSLLDIKKDSNSLVANMNNAANLKNKRKQDNDYQFLFEKQPCPNVFDENDMKAALSVPYQKKTHKIIKKQKASDRTNLNHAFFSANNRESVVTCIVNKDVFDRLICN